MSDTASEFVTCLCNTCSGKIEFERALFDPEAPASVVCPHCGLETQLCIPSLPVSIPAAETPPQIPTPPVILQAVQPLPSGGSSLASQLAALESLALDPRFTPTTFQDFVGQERVKARLELVVTAAKQRHEVLDHVLLVGPPGTGKTTLAVIIAKAMRANLRNTSGPTIPEGDFLAGLLTNLEEGDVLFINAIHRLPKGSEQYLYPAIEDFRLDVIIDQGANARSVRLNLPRFTLIGTTPRKEGLSPRLLSYFPIVETTVPYGVEELNSITKRFAFVLGSAIEEQAANEIVRSSDGTPRDVLKFLRRVQGYAQVKAPCGKITADIAAEALKLFAPWEEASEPRQVRDSDGNRTAIPSKVRREVWRRDRGRCVKCGSRKSLEYDHIIPVVKGGSNTARNIELLCERCNRSKRDSIQ
jgi:holliday junction DNA helicase RuvB